MIQIPKIIIEIQNAEHPYFWQIKLPNILIKKTPNKTPGLALQLGVKLYELTCQHIETKT